MANLKRYDVDYVDGAYIQHCGLATVIMSGPWQNDGPYVDGTRNTYAPAICLHCGQRGQILIDRSGKYSLTIGGETIEDGRPIKVGYAVLAADIKD